MQLPDGSDYEKAKILDSRVGKVLAYILILLEKVRETSET